MSAVEGGARPYSVRAEQRALDAMMHAEDPAVVDSIAAVVERADFYQERHAELFDAILAQRKEGAPTSADAVAERLARTDLPAFGRLADYLTTTAVLGTPAEQGTYWAGIVAAHAAVRRELEDASRYRQVVESGDRERIAAEQRRLAEQWTATPRARTAGPRAAELDAFLAADDPEHDWLVPGLIERGDRVILTGGEGRGKSTLLRQIGVQAASGIHPFGGAPYAPLRVLRLDVENGERRERRALRPLRFAAGDRYAGSLMVISRVVGLDLTAARDCDWLHDLAAGHDPDLLITGPAYKMHAGDPNDETAARVVAAHFDRLRAAYGCAIWLEAHSPHASNGGKRPTRPYGASYWLRWPEFGLHLGDGGEITHWRGPRDERDWPTMLQRGGAWPWTAVTDRDLQRWALVRTACADLDERPSQRDLAKLTGESQPTISRLLGKYRDEWDSMTFPQVKG